MTESRTRTTAPREHHLTARCSVVFAALFGMIAVMLTGCAGDEDGLAEERQLTPSASPSETLLPEGTATVAVAETPAGQGDFLRICVEVSPAAASGLSTADAVAHVRDGLPEYARLYALSSDATKKAGASPYPPLATPHVDGACPDGYLPPPQDSMSVKPNPVTTRSPYHLHVFVVTGGEIADRLPTGAKSLRLAYEMEGSGHVFAEVTTALYLPVSELTQAADTGWALADATGLTTNLRYPCGHPDPKPECQGIAPP